MFADIIVAKKNVEVILEHIGEGLYGDYDADNPDDIPLVRFSVLKDGEQVDNSSYCTQLPITMDREVLTKIAETIMKEVYNDVKNGNSVKQLCETLSWINIDKDGKLFKG